MPFLVLDKKSYELSYAWGYIIYDDAPESVLKAREIIGNGRIITIGDIVSLNFLEYFKSDIIVIDHISRRKKLKQTIKNLPETVSCTNPPGTINFECVTALHKILSKGRGALYVKGEEDLLALPAIILCREGDFIIYGNWQGFMQIIPCTNFFRRIAMRLLKRYFSFRES